MLGQMQRFDPLPLIQFGGFQPYQGQQGREQGPALLAMLAGRTAGGWNPMDVTRNLQRVAGNQPSLLASLMSHDTTPGSNAKGGYTITPDQFDRNSAHSLGELYGPGFRPRDPVTAKRHQWT